MLLLPSVLWDDTTSIKDMPLLAAHNGHLQSLPEPFLQARTTERLCARSICLVKARFEDEGYFQPTCDLLDLAAQLDTVLLRLDHVWTGKQEERRRLF